MTNTVFTIGHSNLPLNTFIGLLRNEQIAVVGDVRSQPYSRFNPQYNREALREALSVANIKYVFLGEELGARSHDPACYHGDQVQYHLLAETASFNNGIERVRNGAAQYRIALMCAEREPLECHRTILVARKLSEAGLSVSHILGPHNVETHDKTLERLVSKLRIAPSDMLRSAQTVLDEAYSVQADQIAYRKDERENRKAL